MPFEPFAMERWQSTWENRVRFNLTESGVRALTTRELLRLAKSDFDPLDERLGYPQTNGTEELRRAIATMYPGAGPENVMVTTGSSEANFVNCWTLVEPGDRVAIVVPAYLQSSLLAKNLGAEVVNIPLRDELGWQPSRDDVDAAIRPGTKLVVVTHPNNPTGASLSADAMNHIARRVEEVGAWLLSDEVFIGAELSGEQTPSFWGRAERVIVVGGLSKAYGLPGLRVGWSVAPAQHITSIWARREYTTIAPSALSDRLARVALHPDVRPLVFDRTRAIVRENWRLVEKTLEPCGIRYRAPDAGAIVWVRYGERASSTALAQRILTEEDVLVMPGEHFGLDGYLRLCFGSSPAELAEAFARIARVLGSSRPRT
jgi:aspartate/methionine/tyrosine aminotransferase